MATEKPPYRLVVKLDGARPEAIAEALTELREHASEHDQTGEATATMTMEAHQEALLQAVMESFENWLFHHMPGIDCEMKLTRPGLRPGQQLACLRAHGRTPMDVLLGKRASDELVSSDREPR